MKKTIFQEIKEQEKRNVLLLLTGPTGSGKDAIFNSLLKDDPSIIKIITTTSRSMRTNEKEGNPYYFVNREKFEKLISEGAFFEWVEFRGQLYGTQKKTLTNALSKKVDVIWHIEAKGIKNIKNKVKEMVENSAFVYLTTKSIDVLINRVAKDEGDKIKTRWNESLVKWEMEQYDDCDYLVVNQDGKLSEAIAEIKAIIKTKKLEIKKV